MTAGVGDTLEYKCISQRIKFCQTAVKEHFPCVVCTLEIMQYLYDSNCRDSSKYAKRNTQSSSTLRCHINPFSVNVDHLLLILPDTQLQFVK